MNDSTISSDGVLNPSYGWWEAERSIMWDFVGVNLDRLRDILICSAYLWSQPNKRNDDIVRYWRPAVWTPISKINSFSLGNLPMILQHATWWPNYHMLETVKMHMKISKKLKQLAESPLPVLHLPRWLQGFYQGLQTTGWHYRWGNTRIPRMLRASLGKHSHYSQLQIQGLRRAWSRYPSFQSAVKQEPGVLLTPIKFHNPICQPRTVGAGKYHFCCVSNIKSVPETMKPVPPMTCGSQ